MFRRLALVLALSAAASHTGAAQAPLGQATAAPAINRLEYPRYDAGAVSFLERGLLNKSIARRLKETTDDADLPRLLFERQRFDEGLTALRLIVQQRPLLIAAAFRISLLTVTNDRTVNVADPLLELVGLARTRLAVLPREQAAVAARTLLDAEMTLQRLRDRLPRLKAFTEEYADRAAQLTEVDM